MYNLFRLCFSKVGSDEIFRLLVLFIANIKASLTYFMIIASSITKQTNFGHKVAALINAKLDRNYRMDYIYRCLLTILKSHPILTL